ncbi:MAG TPA: type IV secretory system conjugative DNA transfer family protein [Magnetospirillaceae bacterium]|jgi:type IV secretion system protein VirD4
MSGTMTLYGRAPAGLRNLGSDADDAITLGRLVHRDGSIGHRIRIGEALPTLVIGPNGSGKGTRFLMPNLLQNNGASLVVVDPKGELTAVSAPFRRQFSRVVVLNPFNVLVDIPGYEDMKSEGYNPFIDFDPASPSFNVKTSLLAEAIVPITGREREPHWDESARSMVSAFAMYTVLEAQRLGMTPTIERMRELICEASFAPSEANNFEGVGIPKRALEMMKSGIPGLANKASQFSDWNREIQSIASTARRHTESFDDPEIAADLAKGTFDFHDLKREPTTVYLILPPEMMERHAKWLRLILTSAIHSCLRARRPGEPKVIFLIDEFHALGRLDLITNVWALTRGYGVQIVPVLQDLNQLKRLYPDMWETFIGMAGAVVSFAPNDITTAQWMETRAGFATRLADTMNENLSRSITDSGGRSSGGNGSSNTGWSVADTSSKNTSSAPVKVPLMSAHQMYGLEPGYLMIALNGLQNVVPAYAPAYYQIHECIARARANPYYQR